MRRAGSQHRPTVGAPDARSEAAHLRQPAATTTHPTAGAPRSPVPAPSGRGRLQVPRRASTGSSGPRRALRPVVPIAPAPASNAHIDSRSGFDRTHSESSSATADSSPSAILSKARSSTATSRRPVNLDRSASTVWSSPSSANGSPRQLPSTRCSASRRLRIVPTSTSPGGRGTPGPGRLSLRCTASIVEANSPTSSGILGEFQRVSERGGDDDGRRRARRPARLQRPAQARDVGLQRAATAGGGSSAHSSSINRPGGTGLPASSASAVSSALVAWARRGQSRHCHDGPQHRRQHADTVITASGDRHNGFVAAVESGADDPCHPRIDAGTALGDRSDAAISFRRAATAVRRNHWRRRTLVHWELLDRSSFSNRASPSPRRSPRHSGADLHHRTPRSPSRRSSAIDSPRRTSHQHPRISRRGRGYPRRCRPGLPSRHQPHRNQRSAPPTLAGGRPRHHPHLQRRHPGAAASWSQRPLNQVDHHEAGHDHEPTGP